MKEWVEEVIGVSWRTSEREGSCWGGGGLETEASVG